MALQQLKPLLPPYPKSLQRSLPHLQSSSTSKVFIKRQTESALPRPIIRDPSITVTSYLRVPPPSQSSSSTQPPNPNKRAKIEADDGSMGMSSVWDWYVRRSGDGFGRERERELDGRREGMNWNDPAAPVTDREKGGSGGGRLIPMAFD